MNLVTELMAKKEINWIFTVKTSPRDEYVSLILVKSQFAGITIEISLLKISKIFTYLVTVKK